jgi:hypothetical protein
MDDTTKRNSPDSKRINLSEDHEVRYWTQALGVTEQELREAVKAAGSSAEKVREHLRK